MCHGYLLRVREMWGRAYYCFRFIVVGFNDAGASLPRLALKEQDSPVWTFFASAAQFKTCSQNERGNKLSYQSPPPRLQGISKNPNVTHNPAITSTKQKSENISRRYTYGIGETCLGRCPVAIYYRQVTYLLVTFRPETYPTVTYQPVTYGTPLTKYRMVLAKVSTATGRLPWCTSCRQVCLSVVVMGEGCLSVWVMGCCVGDICKEYSVLTWHCDTHTLHWYL